MGRESVSMVRSFQDHKYEELYSSRYTPALADKFLAPQCMYCGSSLEREDKVIRILWGDPREEAPPGRPSATVDIPQRILLRCSACGWWLVLWDTHEKDYPSGMHHYEIGHYWGLLRQFDVTSFDLPLSELRSYLLSHQDKIYALGYRQFGRLMNDCFKNTMQCTVDYLDGPHDSGIDALLYLVDCTDGPYLVQYKAREAARPDESVSVVRDALGAMVANGKRHAILVTTRERWSYQAVATADREALRRAGFYVELYDCGRVIDLISKATTSESPPWEDFFDPVILRPDFLRETMEAEKKWKRAGRAR